MLQFDMNKKKIFSVPTLVEGVEPSKLQFYFRVIVEGIEYGFPAKLLGEQMKLEIPPLGKVITGLKQGEYMARVEANVVTEGNKGFYMKPWEEKIEVRMEPKVSMEIKEEKAVQESSDIKIAMASLFEGVLVGDEPKEEPKVEEKEEETKKKSKFAEKFGKKVEDEE